MTRPGSAVPERLGRLQPRSRFICTSEWDSPRRLGADSAPRRRVAHCWSLQPAPQALREPPAGDWRVSSAPPRVTGARVRTGPCAHVCNRCHKQPSVHSVPGVGSHPWLQRGPGRPHSPGASPPTLRKGLPPSRTRPLRRPVPGCVSSSVRPGGPRPWTGLINRGSRVRTPAPVQGATGREVGAAGMVPGPGSVNSSRSNINAGHRPAGRPASRGREAP